MLAGTSDEHGNKTYYFYNIIKDLTRGFKNVLDVITEYVYDDTTEQLKTVKTYKKDADGNNVVLSSPVNYTYSGTKLSTINYGTDTYRFSYDNFGNVISTSVGGKALSINTYGEKNGVLQSTSYGNGAVKNYTYDVYGNLTGVGNGGSTVYRWYYDSAMNPMVHRDAVNNLRYNYEYDGIGRLIRQELRSYDNSLRYGATEYTYDLRNNVTKIANEMGGRTSKTVNGVATTYYLDGTNIIEQITGDTVLRFHYDSNDEIIGFTHNEADYFYVKNAMSDIIAITDSNKNIVAEYRYDPWGKVLSVTGSNTEIGNLNPFRYRGYYYDTETGLYYLQSRYYDPETGRFINADDVNYIGYNGTDLSYNAFAYCVNNFINAYDYDGNWKRDVHSGYNYYPPNKIRLNSSGRIKYKGEYLDYGTYTWALEIGYPEIAAWMIAEADNLVDKEYSAVTVNNLSNQGWHFNVNRSGLDSRDEKTIVCVIAAAASFEKANKYYKKGKKSKAEEYLSYAYQYIGMALHPLQDKYSHTDKVTNFREIPIYDGYGGVSYLYFYEHVVYDNMKKNKNKKADDAQAHVQVIFDVVAVETNSILEAFFVEYRTLIKKCTPKSSFKKLFPKSYNKVVKFKNNRV